MRKSLLLLLALVLASTTLSVSASAQNGERATTVNWLQYRGDTRRSGFNPYETQITPATASGLHLSKIAGFPFDGPTPPLVSGNTLYSVGRSFIDPNTNSLAQVDEFSVYAFDPVTGRTKWSQAINCGFGQPRAMPVISTTAHMLLLPNDEGCDTPSGDGHLVGFDLVTRSVKWVDSSFQRWGNPAVLGGTVFVSGSWLGSYDLFSSNAATGLHNWDYSNYDEFGNSHALGDPSVAGGQVYFRENVDGVDMLTSLNATTGAWLWTKGSATGDPTIGGDGSIYVDCDKGICAYNRYGSLRWSFEPGAGEIAYANGTVYVGCDVGLCALNGNGSLLWSTPVQTPTTISVAGGVVFTGAGALGFNMVNAATGEHLDAGGEYSPLLAPGPVRANTFGTAILPNEVVVVNGHVYLINENRLYIFGLS